MSKSLFEEAIADAKQLREAAEANAKNAIIEAVTPRIREFIESQLVGGSTVAESDFLADTLLNEEDEEVDEEVELDESALKSLAKLVSSGKNTESAALQEAFDTLTEEEQDKLLGLIREEEANKVAAAPAKSAGTGLNNVGEGSDNLYEIDLDELKESLTSVLKTKKASRGASKMSRKTLRENYEEADLYELDEMMDDEGDLEEAILKLVGSAEEREAFDKLGLSGIDFEEEEGEDEEVAMGDEEGEGEEAAAAPPEGGEEPMAEDAVYEIDENMLR